MNKHFNGGGIAVHRLQRKLDKQLTGASLAALQAGFVQRQGTQLLEWLPQQQRPQQLRFASFNAPGLVMIEDPNTIQSIPAHHKHSWASPTSDEQSDLLSSLRQMGGRVARLYPPSIPKSATDPLERHIIVTAGYGTPNASWQLSDLRFADLDRTLALASQYQIRLIIPLIDNWEWWGGRGSFASIYGATNTDEFFTNPAVIGGFKQFVSAIVSRKNSITGVLYRDDPTILAWETGNELSMGTSGGTGDPRQAPAEWTLAIANHLKAIDANHLVVDGGYGLYGWPDQVLQDSSPIDILSNHYYQLAAASKITSQMLPYAILLGIVAGVCLVVAVIEWTKPEWLNLRGSFNSKVSDSRAISKVQVIIPTSSLLRRYSISILVFTSLACVLLVVFLSFYSSLFPPTYGARAASDIAIAKAHNKAFIAGEFGLADVGNMKSLVDTVVATQAAGAPGNTADPPTTFSTLASNVLDNLTAGSVLFSVSIGQLAGPIDPGDGSRSVWIAVRAVGVSGLVSARSNATLVKY
eukprot:jgi/Hompol1/5424/HPOL_004425-RA